MTEKAPISDFNFGPGSQELTPFDVASLLQEYGDGRRKFNQIDLKNANLSDAHLPYIQMEESLLQKVDLKNAILAGACLNHIDLSAANLTRINLIAADLIRAKLAGANLTGAFLSGANLSGANLRRSNLTDCTLAGANLSGVDFSGAILKNTNMAGATLRGANLSAVDLNDLDLAELNLEGCILPADHGGATWAALRPGEDSEGYDIATEPEPSHGLPEDSYPLDAFDSSYEELIQNLAEAAEWSGGHAAPAPFEASFPESVSASSPEENEAFPPPSPFGLSEPDPSEPDFSEPDLSDETTAETQIFHLEENWEAQVQPESLNGQRPAEHEQPHAGALIPLQNQSGFELLKPDSEPSPSPAVPSHGAAGSGLPHLLAQQNREARYNHHQEEVIKTIQSALNRRTHYSLKRKLLEIYGKRCAITGCPIRPLLDTVLIDNSQTAVADHPSNGLVLRNDIKVLYNLYLIAVNPEDYTVALAPSLRRSSYGHLDGRKIILPKQAIYHPNREYLQTHLAQCKWQSYGDAQTLKPLVTDTTDVEFEEDDSSSKDKILIGAALLLGGGIVGGLLATLLWLLLPLRSPLNLADVNPPETAGGEAELVVPTVSVDPENRIRLQLGPLVHPRGGVIFEDSAYLSVLQLQRQGLLSGLSDSAEVIQVDGQQFVKADTVRDLGLTLDWDADTRTVALDCCQNLELEPINIALEGQPIESEGLIIEGSSYAPIDIFESLSLAPVQVPGEYFVGVDQQFYVQSGGLKAIGLDVIWNGETRTLNLEQ